jgi:hypothetical protein
VVTEIQANGSAERRERRLHDLQVGGRHSDLALSRASPRSCEHRLLTQTHITDALGPPFDLAPDPFTRPTSYSASCCPPTKSLQLQNTNIDTNIQTGVCDPFPGASNIFSHMRTNDCSSLVVTDCNSSNTF